MADDVAAGKQNRGAVKFFLLHHAGCPRQGGFHHIVDAGGSRAVMDESERGQHPAAIAILVDGDYDQSTPESAVLDGLRNLLLDLKLRYPAAILGAHRQVRGDSPLGKATTCPGRRFPMKALQQWFVNDLPRLRDERLASDVESQYSRLS